MSFLIIKDIQYELTSECKKIYHKDNTVTIDIKNIQEITIEPSIFMGTFTYFINLCYVTEAQAQQVFKIYDKNNTIINEVIKAAHILKIPITRISYETQRYKVLADLKRRTDQELQRFSSSF